VKALVYDLQVFLEEIKSVQIELDRELSNRRIGIDGDGTIEQLEASIDELKHIENMAIYNTLPPKEQRHTAFTWYITDSWNHGSELGNKLCGFADKYKRKLR